MTDRLRAAAQAALEAIEELEYSSSTAVADKMARDAKRLLRAALAEPEAEPRREWTGLTDEEVSEIIDRVIGFNNCWGLEKKFARAIEAALKGKNHDSR